MAKQKRIGERPYQKDNVPRVPPGDQSKFTMYISPASEPGSTSKLVSCRVSENVQISIANDYGPFFDGRAGNDTAVGRIWQVGTGRSLAIQESSRQVWRGSTSGTFSFDIEFVAYRDPRTEVIDQIKALYKLASPSGATGQEKGVIEKLKSALLEPPGLINIDIPDVLSLTNFYIQEVQFAQAMKLMRSMDKAGNLSDEALPLSATGSITIVPEYMFLKEDIDFVFLGGTNPTSVGG